MNRSTEVLVRSGLAVIDSAIEAGAITIAPLFSGGHDSLCAVHLASQHPKFGGDVHHINTGIGSAKTREFVGEVCREFGWTLKEYRSKNTYEEFIRHRGFPGPGMHQWVYVRLKDRCVRQIVNKKPTALLTGCRREESVRRMGTVKPLKIGEPGMSKGKPILRERNRYWTAPCHDWTGEEQAEYMAEHELPKNPVKIALGMSGECFCGAFASPGELDRIRQHCPDVANEIDRLSSIATECGMNEKWGTRPDRKKGIVAVESGPLCSSCDRRAYAAGLLFDSCEN